MSKFREGDVVRYRVNGENYIVEPKFPNAPVGVKDGEICSLRVLRPGTRDVDRRRRIFFTKLNEKDFQILGHPSEEYSAYHLGFRDGVCHRPKREEHSNHKNKWIRLSYLIGYGDGGRTMSEVMADWRKSIGYEPSILRG